jgi:DNA repair protein RadC
MEELKAEVGGSAREMMVILYLNTKNGVIGQEIHSVGTVDSSSVYPREIFKSALLADATALIMVHNHPSGDPDPSQCDREITRAVINGAYTLGLKVHDHIILGDGRDFSFADHGLMQDYLLLAMSANPL